MGVADFGRIVCFVSDALIAGYAGVDMLGSVILHASRGRRRERRRRRHIACLVTFCLANINTSKSSDYLESDVLRKIALLVRVPSFFSGAPAR